MRAPCVSMRSGRVLSFVAWDHTVDRLNVAQRQFTECKRVASPIRSTLRSFAARRIRGERALLFCVVESTPGTAHVDFPLLQRIALPITIGSVRYPGRHNAGMRIAANALRCNSWVM